MRWNVHVQQQKKKKKTGSAHTVRASGQPIAGWLACVRVRVYVDQFQSEHRRPSLGSSSHTTTMDILTRYIRIRDSCSVCGLRKSWAPPNAQWRFYTHRILLLFFIFGLLPNASLTCLTNCCFFNAKVIIVTINCNCRIYHTHTHNARNASAPISVQHSVCREPYIRHHHINTKYAYWMDLELHLGNNVYPHQPDYIYDGSDAMRTGPP